MKAIINLSLVLGLASCSNHYASRADAKKASQSWEREGEAVKIVSRPSEESIERERKTLEKKIRKDKYECRKQPGYQLYEDDIDEYIKRYDTNTGYPDYLKGYGVGDKFINCDAQLNLKRFYAMAREGVKSTRYTRECIEEKENKQFVCGEVSKQGDEYDWSKYSRKYFRY